MKKASGQWLESAEMDLAGIWGQHTQFQAEIRMVSPECVPECVVTGSWPDVSRESLWKTA